MRHEKKHYRTGVTPIKPLPDLPLPKLLLPLPPAIKATGFSGALPKVTATLFYIDEADPLAGRTGHTGMVRRNEGVPAVFQEERGGGHSKE